MKVFLKIKSGRGFTLIELLIVMAIIALFVVFGAPAFNRYNYKQEVDTKAEEAKSLIDGAYLRSQNIEQGYDSTVVTYSEKKMFSSLANTNQCEFTSFPDLSKQIEGIDFSSFKTILNMGVPPQWSGSGYDSLLICYSGSGLKRSYYYKSTDLTTSPKRSYVATIKISSINYDNYGFETTPLLHIFSDPYSPSNTQNRNQVTELKYE